MSWSMIVRNDSGTVTYNLDDLADIGMADFDGVGMAPAEYFTEQGAQQMGATVRGYRLRPRVISIVLWSVEQTKSDYWAKRETILRMFRPGLKITLKKTLPNTATRYIDGYFADGMTLGSQDRKAWTQRVGMNLFCPDPLWYGEEIEAILWDTWTVGVRATKNLDLAYVGSAYEYPSSVSILPERTILGAGIGDAIDPIVVNTATGDKLDFTGYTIDAGRVILVDCRYGYKTAVDDPGYTGGTEANVISALSADSDLTTFGIAAAEDGTSSRINRFTLTTTVTNPGGPTLDVFLIVTYRPRYLGI